jgi:biopolymer transport protein ExbD
MIDVAFFLLVFFLLVGRFDATAPFEVRLPAGDGAAELPSGGIVLALDPGGALSVSGTAVEREVGLSVVEARLRAEPSLWVRLEADRDARLRDLLPLLAALETMGARDVALVVARDAR